LGRRCGRNPAVVIDGAVAEHLEVLRVALGRGLRVRWVPGVCHADAFDRLLGDAVDHQRCGNAGSFEDGRHYINNVVELGANAAHILDVAKAQAHATAI
jgi:hypothetical protein